MADHTPLRQAMRHNTLTNEADALGKLLSLANLTASDRSNITQRAVKIVKDIRAKNENGMMETFLEEYGLSTDEGISLMCLAEALLRVPDSETIDALIEDKIVPSNWGIHLGQSSSSLVNASTWALLMTGRVLDDSTNGVAGTLRKTIKRLGEPVIRAAVAQAMREMGRQFVLGRNIGEAMDRASKRESRGFTYSYDMLGEAAMTDTDALRYHQAYSDAINAIANACESDDIRENPGISIKLSALFPRYEFTQYDRVMETLVPRVKELALAAKAAGMGLNIDAEEADRLDLSLVVIERVLEDPDLAGWDGFGVVVQAYGRRAPYVIDWLYALAGRLDRKIMVRLVKGAYWDTEIKNAQVLGIEDYPVFTRKSSTDLSYIANARKLLGMTDRIYPQFATHNAHSVAAILEMADDKSMFEFQRLHGMGDVLHDIVKDQESTRCRIYAPVGAHRDLLAYLVRRLLENGANSSFVNQIVDEDVPPEEVAADPIADVEEHMKTSARNIAIPLPTDIYAPSRKNAKGWDLNDIVDLGRYENERVKYILQKWSVGPKIAGSVIGADTHNVENPADPDDVLGTVQEAAVADVETALAAAKPWEFDAKTRAKVLNTAADLYEQNAGEIFAVLAREAGKNPFDAIAELREAVDFLRYYATQAESLTTPARGVFACISPWNFPLAIFSGQIAAALAAGNAVIAKPAETTPIIASLAVDMLHQAGVPKTALQLLPGAGSVIGAAMSSDPRINGMCFTGSTATAQHINRSMAANLAPDAPLIAETGGLNAMIVDSTALPEQAVRDIVASAFQSAGQRCSALRMLYVQEDVAEGVLTMLKGAMDALSIGNPWEVTTDVGPVIDVTAKTKIENHIAKAQSEGRVLHQLDIPNTGHFVSPTIISVSGIEDMAEEIFGPVLHVTTFKAGEIPDIVAAVNNSGYGLTFGLHTRIDSRVEDVLAGLQVGNAYVNRNQIGAIVGSQPFGGEGLSGTGPKAGGPNYIHHFTQKTTGSGRSRPSNVVTAQEVQKAIDNAPLADMHTPLSAQQMPGVTGESNRLSYYPRGKVLCLGPHAETQAREAKSEGCVPIIVNGSLPFDALSTLQGFDAVVFWGSQEDARKIRCALAARDGALLPLITETDYPQRYHLERHLCVDTTASGGNTQLLSVVEDGS